MQFSKRPIILSLLALACILAVILKIQRGSFGEPKTSQEPISTSSSLATQQITQRQKTLEKSKDANTVFGFIHSMNTERNSISIQFDEAEFIKNRTPSSAQDTKPGAADLAAIEDGMCGATITEVHVGECAPNGFYIRNNSTTTKELFLNSNTKIIILAQSPTIDIHPQAITLDTFQKAFLTPASPYNNPYYALTEGPYQVKLKNNTVIELKSVYIP